MINELKNNLDGSYKVLNTDIEELYISDKDKVIISEIVTELKKPYFCEKFLRDSYLYDQAVFITDNTNLILCYIESSVMLNNGINMLMGTALETLDFIICQHVTSCDFIYFPKFHLYFPVTHSNNVSATKYLRLLLNLLEKKPGNSAGKKNIKGLILSHNRPYHFFYDTSLMIELINKYKLLEKFDHYQMLSSDFVHFDDLYDLNHITAKVIDYKVLNTLIENKNEIFFKVGIRFEKGTPKLRALSDSFDSRLNSYAKDKTKDSVIIKKLQNHKKKGCFVLWFGICSEKRSLENQVELLVNLANELSKFNEVCILVDGWTSSYSGEKGDAEYIEADYRIFKKIKELSNAVDVLSLIGKNSIYKISAAHYVDFHVSSGATGSMWPSRFAKKLGVLHMSQAFYPRIFEHLHYNSVHYPTSLVEDSKLKAKRMDFVSYSINSDDFISFIRNNFPNIFSKGFHLLKVKVSKLINVICVNQIENIYESKNNDSQIYLESNFLNGITYPYILKFVVYIKYFSNVEKSVAAFYFNYGDGFNSKDVVTISLDNSRNNEQFEVDVLIEKPLMAIRFDPVSVKANFQFKGLFYKIKEV